MCGMCPGMSSSWKIPAGSSSTMYLPTDTGTRSSMAHCRTSAVTSSFPSADLNRSGGSAAGAREDQILPGTDASQDPVRDALLRAGLNQIFFATSSATKRVPSFMGLGVSMFMILTRGVASETVGGIEKTVSHMI